MLLSWTEITRYYGHYAKVTTANFQEYSERLDKARSHTYGLLLTNYSKTRFVTSETFASNSSAHKVEHRVHAEKYLVNTKIWKTDVKGALERRHIEHPYITIILNRTPCPACTALLVEMIGIQHEKAGMDKNDGSATFILCCLGRYKFTNDEDLVALKGAGWTLTVLEMAGKLTMRGGSLLERYQNILDKGGYFRFPA